MAGCLKANQLCCCCRFCSVEAAGGRAGPASRSHPGAPPSQRPCHHGGCTPPQRRVCRAVGAAVHGGPGGWMAAAGAGREAGSEGICKSPAPEPCASWRLEGCRLCQPSRIPGASSQLPVEQYLPINPHLCQQILTLACSCASLQLLRTHPVALGQAGAAASSQDHASLSSSAARAARAGLRMSGTSADLWTALGTVSVEVPHRVPGRLLAV